LILIIGVNKMIYGYIRPFYNDENMQIQKDMLQGCEVIFEEKHGGPKKRVELENLLIEMQAGDIIRVSRFFSIADSKKHLVELLAICKRDDVKMEFIQEKVTNMDFLNMDLETILKHFTSFQSDIIKQSTIIGMAEAKAKGKSIGRPKKSDDNVKKAIDMYQSGKFTLLDIKNETGISKSTLYRYLESLE